MASSTIDTINEVEIRSPASASFISLDIFAKFLQCYFNGGFQSIDKEIRWEEGKRPLLEQQRRVEKYFSGFTVLNILSVYASLHGKQKSTQSIKLL